MNGNLEELKTHHEGQGYDPHEKLGMEGSGFAEAEVGACGGEGDDGARQARRLD